MATKKLAKKLAAIQSDIGRMLPWALLWQL